ncbi:MAG: hypothetical protein WDO71_00380 [Bacteroidota bacterium]
MNLTVLIIFTPTVIRSNQYARKYFIETHHTFLLSAGQGLYSCIKSSSMKKKLRSYDWFGKSDKMGFVHRSWLRNQDTRMIISKTNLSLVFAIPGVN